MFQGKIEGENRNNLLQKLRSLHFEGYRCLLRCPSLMQYPMSDVLNGRISIEPVICTCGGCIATTIIKEEIDSYPLQTNKCFRFNAESVCLLLHRVMLTTNNSLEEFFAKSWLRKSLTRLCLFKSRQPSTHERCNKLQYKNHVRELRVLHRCRRDRASYVLHKAMLRYTVGKYDQTLRLVHQAKEAIFSQNSIYIAGITSDQYGAAGGTDLPLETVLRKFSIDFCVFLEINVPEEFFIENYCNVSHRRFMSATSPAICALFLQYLCYSNLGNQQKREESLCEISFIIQHDNDHHIKIWTRSDAWRILGICQQMSCHYRAAFHSYRMGLRLDRLNFNTAAMCIRLGTVLSKFF